MRERSLDLPKGKVELYLLFIAMKYSHPEMYLPLLRRDDSSDELWREIRGFISDGSCWSVYTKESANLTRTNNFHEWRRIMECFFIITDVEFYERIEPIYEFIDKSIEKILQYCA